VYSEKENVKLRYSVLSCDIQMRNETVGELWVSSRTKVPYNAVHRIRTVAERNSETYNPCDGTRNFQAVKNEIYTKEEMRYQ
jgi:hypothetical protein